MSGRVDMPTGKHYSWTMRTETSTTYATYIAPSYASPLGLSLDRIEDARLVQRLHELASNLADAVEANDMTADEANTWYNDKADQWADSGVWS
jgi:hypothetical protein